MSSSKCISKTLQDNFLPIIDKNPPPLGPVGDPVFRRTYSRPFDADKPDDTEDWAHFIQRLVLSAKYQFHIPMSLEEEVELFDLMYNMKMIPAGRFLWQMGT